MLSCPRPRQCPSMAAVTIECPTTTTLCGPLPSSPCCTAFTACCQQSPARCHTWSRASAPSSNSRPFAYGQQRIQHASCYTLTTAIQAVLNIRHNCWCCLSCHVGVSVSKRCTSNAGLPSHSPTALLVRPSMVSISGACLWERCCSLLMLCAVACALLRGLHMMVFTCECVQNSMCLLSCSVHTCRVS